MDKFFTLDLVLNNPFWQIKFNEDEKLRGVDNYYEWLEIFKFKMNVVPELRSYLVDGESSIRKDYDEDTRLKFIELSERIITRAIWDGVAENPRQIVCEFNGSGRLLFYHLKKTYFNIWTAFTIVCDYEELNWKNKKERVLYDFMNSSHRIMRITDSHGFDFYMAVKFLADLKRGGIPDSMTKQVIDHYHSRYGSGPENFTVTNIIAIIEQVIRYDFKFVKEDEDKDQSKLSNSRNDIDSHSSYERANKTNKRKRPRIDHDRFSDAELVAKIKKNEKITTEKKTSVKKMPPHNNGKALIEKNLDVEEIFFSNVADVHMVVNRKLLTDFKKCKERIHGYGGFNALVLGKGKVRVALANNQYATLNEVFYVPEARINQISIPKVTSKGSRLKIAGNFVCDAETGEVLGKKGTVLN